MRRWIPLLLLSATLLAPACSRRATAREGGPRLVVLFAVCTLTRDRLAPYNPAIEYTPTLAALGRAGVVFERHQTEAGQSGTAFASLFTGAQADRHGVYTHPSRLRDELHLVAEAFADNGWDTWFWHGHPMASPDLNYAQGVPRANQVSFRHRGVTRLTPEDPDVERLLRRLAEDEDYHAFLQLNFSYTHEPYHESREAGSFGAFQKSHPDRVPIDHAELERRMAEWDHERLQLQWNFRETRARLKLDDEHVARMAEAVEICYEAGVYLLDLHLAQFLGMLQSHGLEDDVLIAFTADHGQVMYRESALFQWTHGLQLAPEELGVPLILYGPGLLAPGRYPSVTRSIDVYPTLAGLAGIELERDAGVAGVDLAPALLGTAPAPELDAFSHSTTINPLMAEQTRAWTLFHALFPTPRPESLWVALRRGDQFARLRSHADRTWSCELFDLAADPFAVRDRFDADDPAHAALCGELEGYKTRLVAAFRQPDTKWEEKQHRRQALEKLVEMGYAGEEAAANGEDEEGSR